MSNSVRLHRQQPTRLPRPGILQARTLEWVAYFHPKAASTDPVAPCPCWEDKASCPEMTC